VTPIAERSPCGKLVTIGPILPDDTASIFLWRNDVAAAKLDLPYRPVDWMSYNNWLNDVGRDSARVLFAIRKLVEPQIIGFALLSAIHPIHRSAELGIRIGQEQDRGNGYGKEATMLMLDYAWKSLNLNRVQLEVFANNERAIRTYRSVGFEHEGTRKRAAFIDGEWIDVAFMGALRPSAEDISAIPSTLSGENVVNWAEQGRPTGRIAAN
jgi:RimJ/RimL family protein N-acetyltransferase